MLSISNCQLDMKDTKAAKKTWEEIIKTYPDSEAAGAAKERVARFK
jgi:TolA-binding protein